MTSNEDNFNDDNLKFLYDKYHEKELFDINQIWENLKFFMLITTIFIPILTTVPFLFNLSNIILNKIFKISFVLSITAFLILILFTIKSNSERHYKRWAEWRGTNIKISEKLKLNEKTSFKIFPDEKFLHPFKYINPTEYANEPEKIKSVKKYIDVKFHFKNSFINKVKKVFWLTLSLLILINIALILVFIFI
ncbi:hypothetical protein LCGC14_2912480 [marine sediment metagenome]|uniref:Uncharacterized protein n=1 Tax=marine sediment metagenome TaxID=412755 RepID=A0A0F8YD03_9ZZZZ